MGKAVIRTAVLLAAVLLLTAGSNVQADRMENLETRLQQLEQQNAELKAMVQDLVGELRQQQEVVESVKEVQETQEAASPMEGFMANAKVGGDWRLRGIMKENMWDLDDNNNDSWEWYRMRTRLWVSSQLLDNLRVYFRGANEYKWGIDSKANTLLVDAEGLDIIVGNKQFFVDNAYIEWSQPLDIEPLTLKIGRQDLIYGEGFMILDGQDNVGSMAIAFDGVKASLALGEKTTLDLLAMKIEEHAKQNADDEDLYGLYLTDTSLFEDHKLEGYVLHRNRNSVEDYFASVGGCGAIVPKQHTTAIGGRISGSFLDKKLSYAVEGNYQFGEIENVDGAFFSSYDVGDDLDRRAYGGYLWGKYAWLDTDWKPYIKLAGLYTSGDDPDTSDYEGFDTFYAEWPKWSEGYIYQLYDPFFPAKRGTDPDMGAWTNIIIARAEVGASPIENMGLTLAYQHLWADEDTLGNGDDRGDMVVGLATYNFNKYLSGHLLGEYFWPDKYYDDDADEAFFARWQLMLKF